MTKNSLKPGQSIVAVVVEDRRKRDISIHGAQAKKDEKKRKNGKQVHWLPGPLACAENSCSHLHRNSIKYRRVHAHCYILASNISQSMNST